MKLKTLNKKIHRLEARLQKGAQKLARLKRKVPIALAAASVKSKKKSAGGAGKARQSTKASSRTQKEKGRLTARTPVKSAGVKGPAAARKVKRKLNLSPERRAQLAAAMKARWAAKRGAVEATSQEASANHDFTIGQAPQSP
jgi:hypothetical protein